MKKKVFTIAGVAFLIYFIAYQPDSAASVFKKLGGVLRDIALGFADFVGNIAN